MGRVKSTGMRSFHFHDFFPKDKIKGDPSQTTSNRKKTSKRNAHFPFGNSVWEFWSTFQKIPFSRENFRSERQNYSFYLQSIRNFRILWVNGKQPNCQMSDVYVMGPHCNTRVSFDLGIVKVFCSYTYDLLK